MQDTSFSSFELAIEQNKGKIFRLCRVYAVLPISPEDLFQEVVIEAWKSFSTFKGDANAGTWLFRVALNICLRSKMKWEKKQKNHIRLDSIEFQVANETPDEGESLRVRFLRECISTLNETDQSMVILYLEDFPYKEIAHITGLTENHVAVKMKRIKTRLFNCITPKLNNNE